MTGIGLVPQGIVSASTAFSLPANGTTFAAAATSPSTATASFSLESDGDYASHSGDQGDWITPKSAAGSAYEARFTATSGSFSSSPSGWNALSSTRTVTRERTAGEGSGSNSVTFTCEIRRASDSTVLVTATGLVLQATIL